MVSFFKYAFKCMVRLKFYCNTLYIKLIHNTAFFSLLLLHKNSFSLTNCRRHRYFANIHVLFNFASISQISATKWIISEQTSSQSRTTGNTEKLTANKRHWQASVSPAPSACRSNAIGKPTFFERPQTTAFFPKVSTPTYLHRHSVYVSTEVIKLASTQNTESIQSGIINIGEDFDFFHNICKIKYKNINI